MSGIPLHPAIVHLPLGLAFVMPVIAGLVLAGWGAALVVFLAWLYRRALVVLDVNGG